MGSRAELEAMRLMALHERCVGAGLATATIEDAMDSDTPKQALIGLLLDQRPASDKLVAALAEGDAQEREAAYLSIEHTVRAETSLSARDRGGSGGGEKSQAVALAVTCVQPIIEKVLCSPATAEEEHRRAALLLYEMCKLDTTAVAGEMCRKNSDGIVRWHTTMTAPGTAFAKMIAKDASTWTRDDAITASAHCAVWVTMWTTGTTDVFAAGGVGSMDWFPGLLAACPYMPMSPQAADDRFIPLALLVLDLVRREIDSQPEGITVGAGQALCWMQMGRPQLGKAVYEAGMLGVFQGTIQRFSPMERISRELMIPTAMIIAFRETVESASGAGVELVQPLLDAGAVDISISTLTAYQTLGRPEAASKLGVLYLGLWVLGTLVKSPQAKPIVAKLRSAGVDCFRYILDHPVVIGADVEMTSADPAMEIASVVWGREEDSGLVFKQEDIDSVVHLCDHRTDLAQWCFPMKETHGRTIFSLAVSDTHKNLLLNNEGFIPLLIDSLLLDKDHPRMDNVTLMGVTDWEAVKVPVQRDFAAAIAQLATFPRGREALLQDPTVAEALQQAAVEGWTQEARMSCESALLSMSDRQPGASGGTGSHLEDRSDHKHIMISYQWDVQDVVKRIVNELQIHGYRTWFDLQNMKGSTVDAMSEAVDNAEVMLSCITLAYKESANCRLEAQYGHQQDVEMVPLMLELGYKPSGWLGLLLGTKIYFPFHPAAVHTDALFMQQIEAVARLLGERGKPSAAAAARVSEGVPPLEPAPAPAPALAPAAPAVVTTPPRSASAAFSPSMQQLSSPAAAATMVPALPTDDGSLVAAVLQQQGLMLKREAKLQSAMEAKAAAEKAGLRAEMQQQLEQIREEMKPVAAISEQQLTALQARIEKLHAAKLLTDDELYSLEDIVADFLELKSSLGVVTLAAIMTSEGAGKALKLVGLSEGLAADGACARQLRRKFSPA